MGCSPALARIVISPAPPPPQEAISSENCLWVTTFGPDGCYCVIGGVRQEPIGEWPLRFVNRLSDVFFVLGRWVGKHLGEQEYLWERGLSSHARPRKARS